MEKIQKENSFLTYENKDNYIELSQIFVEENERQKGVGTELLNDLIKIAKEKNISKICVVSTADETQDFGKWLVNVGFKNISNDAPQWCLEIENIPETIFGKPIKISVEIPKVEIKTETSVNSFKCSQCEFVGKNINGLRMHGKKHGLSVGKTETKEPVEIVKKKKRGRPKGWRKGKK